jgi:hypothetical protein
LPYLTGEKPIGKQNGWNNTISEIKDYGFAARRK